LIITRAFSINKLSLGINYMSKKKEFQAKLLSLPKGPRVLNAKEKDNLQKQKQYYERSIEILSKDPTKVSVIEDFGLQIQKIDEKIANNAKLELELEAQAQLEDQEQLPLMPASDEPKLEESKEEDPVLVKAVKPDAQGGEVVEMINTTSEPYALQLEQSIQPVVAPEIVKAEEQEVFVAAEVDANANADVDADADAQLEVPANPDPVQAEVIHEPEQAQAEIVNNLIDNLLLNAQPEDAVVEPMGDGALYNAALDHA